jgi:hypothetical protein
VVGVVIERVEDGVLVEVDLLTLVAVAGKAMSGLTLDCSLLAACTVAREEGAIGTSLRYLRRALTM